MSETPHSGRKTPRYSLAFVMLSLATRAFGGDPMGKGSLTPAPSIESFLEEFARQPHPFGSKAQQDYAQQLKSHLHRWGFSSELQSFRSQTPNLSAIPEVRTPEFLKKVAADRKPFLTMTQGWNVIGTRRGVSPCSVILSGHFDTKQFREFTFVGANDGGSSTAMLLDVARRMPAPERRRFGTKPSPDRLANCTVSIVFFDGEEAMLPEWGDGEELLGIDDHLYGSRIFASKLVLRGKHFLWKNEPLRLVMVFDMIGHKKQRLSITAGSDQQAAEKFMQAAEGILVDKTNAPIEDDHVPFQQKGVPILHVIDWTNLGEWHTKYDTLDTVSAEKIERVSNSLIRFLDRR